MEETRATGLGALAIASGNQSTALGSQAIATSSNATSIGYQAIATYSSATAIGGDGQDTDALGAQATQVNTVAIGADAVASASSASALGVGAIANGVNATAIGRAATAGIQATAVGTLANASGDSSAALGVLSNASGAQATAFGRCATASGTNSTALGFDSKATEALSTAVGARAEWTRSNQVVLGGEGSSVTIGDIAASDAAQTGAESIVTVDASGTLGIQNLSSRSIVRTADLRSLAISDAQFAALGNRLDGVEGQVNTLFDLASYDRREAQRGVAAAVALSDAPMPSAAGRTSYTANGALFRGEFAVSASLAHRIGDDNPFAVTAGVSYAGGKNTAARVGVAGEF